MFCFTCFLNLRGLASAKHTAYYDYRPHLQPFNYNLLHDEEGMHVYILFSIPMKVIFFGVNMGKQRKRQQKGLMKISMYCHHELMDQLRLPTYPSQSQHCHLLPTQGKMLIWVNLIAFNCLLKLAVTQGRGRGG